MKKAILLLASLALAACATTEDDVIHQMDPVQDFIKLSNLEEVTVIRGFEDPGVLFMEDPRYIIAYEPREQWLLQYAHECPLARLSSGYRPSDKRRDFRALYSGVDTFRGCPVKAMWPIKLEHAQELVIIGRATGSEN